MRETKETQRCLFEILEGLPQEFAWSWVPANDIVIRPKDNILLDEFNR